MKRYMTSTKLTLLLTLWICLSSYGFAQREIIQLHGFGVGENGWQVYETLFEQEYNINAHQFVYNNLNGLESAAENVLQNLQSANIPTGANNIMMGHSTGGVTIRQMEHFPNASQRALMNQYIGGYITVGSPHRGIGLINSYQNGDLEDFFLDGCQEVITEPIVGTSITFLGPPFAAGGLFLQGITGNLICNSAFTQVEEKLSLFLAPGTLQDLKTGSPALLNLPTSSTKPRIAIYGDEQSPVHWRFLSSLVANPPVEIAPAPAPYVPGDTEFVQIANTVQTLEQTFAAISFTISFIYFYNGSFGNGITAFLVGLQWQQGANWMNNSEMAWNNLIGANVMVPVNQPGTPIFTCWNVVEDIEADYADGAIDFDTYVQNLNNVYSDPNCYAPTTTTVWISNNLISDGLAPMLNTQIIPGDPCHLVIEDANHQEEVHHPNATVVYEKIFELDNDVVVACTQSVADFFEL